MGDSESQAKSDLAKTPVTARPAASLKRKSSNNSEILNEAQQEIRMGQSAEYDDNDNDDVEKSLNAETDDEDEANDPASSIDDFDWKALHERYHQAMETCRKEEDELLKEWFDLMNFFQVWADAGHDQETDRSFKRLKTRTTYVQHSEEKLQRTRSHYMEVVKAFESALELLKAHGFGG